MSRSAQRPPSPRPKCRKASQKPCRRWRPEELPPNFAILLCSARRAGKSTLLKSLTIKEPGSWLSRFDDGFIIAFCGNEHCASEYRPFLPAKYVHNTLRLDIIESYWKWCDATRAAGKKVPSTLFIFDDILVTQSSKKYNVTRTSNDYWLNRLWAEGRHQNISCVLSVQSLSVGLPFIRCSDVFICFPSAFYAGQDHEMLEKNYMPTSCRRTARQIADSFTQHEALVCEYWRQSSRRWQTRVFHYKVQKAVAVYDPEADEQHGTATATDAPDEKGAERPKHWNEAGRIAETAEPGDGAKIP